MNGATPPAASTNYDEVRGLLFQSIFVRSGMWVFNDYWNGFKSFILGRTSKVEFDELLANTLTKDEGNITDIFILLEYMIIFAT